MYPAKRGVDIVVSFLLLLVLWPILVLLTILVIFSVKASPFFIQDRIGYKEKKFRLFKFTTMKLLYDKKGTLLPDKARTTALGAWLRKIRADELPQLLNVVRGDMSLVGPRPLLPEYLSLYSDEVRHKRHAVKPGLTGWAQLKGGSNLAWEQRFEWDLRYVKECNFCLDAKIFLKTPFFLLLGKEGDNIGPYSKEK